MEVFMKHIKTILSAVLIFAIAFMLAACSAGGPTFSTSPGLSSTAENESSAGQEDKTSGETSAAPEDTQTEGNILIAYFSHTGNTEEVARQIADLTGGTLAEIQRAEEYDDLQEEAEAEILGGVHPEITVSIDNVADFDTVFVGYPIWWDEAPAMIVTFLDSYDFSGKTIIPFCTSSSDSIDNSLHIFSELCPDAVIAEGLTANDEEDIEPWLKELGLLQ